MEMYANLAGAGPQHFLPAFDEVRAQAHFIVNEVSRAKTVFFSKYLERWKPTSVFGAYGIRRAP